VSQSKPLTSHGETLWRFSGKCRYNDLALRIPDTYRIGHEAHFGEVTRQFLRYLHKVEPVPTWEKSNMLAKYFVTTSGVALAQGART
jgi:hypothetical protein